MAKINGLILNEMQVLGGTTGCLVGQKEWKEYVDGKPTNRTIGTRFIIAAHCRNFEIVQVKIENAPFLEISDEEIAQANASLTPYQVRFTGFQGKIYNGSNNQAEISCTATDIEIVS